MTKAMLAIAFTLVLAPSAQADPRRGLEARDSAGVWTGVAHGTFQGQPYFTVTVLTIAADGWSATVRSDSTLGPMSSTCEVLRFSPEGDALARCTFTSGVALGAFYDVHYVLTDNQRHIKLWISNPALHAIADLTQP